MRIGHAPVFMEGHNKLQRLQQPEILPIRCFLTDNDACTVLQYSGSIHPCLQQEPHVPAVHKHAANVYKYIILKML